MDGYLQLRIPSPPTGSDLENDISFFSTPSSHRSQPRQAMGTIAQSTAQLNFNQDILLSSSPAQHWQHLQIIRSATQQELVNSGNPNYHHLREQNMQLVADLSAAKTLNITLQSLIESKSCSALAAISSSPTLSSTKASLLPPLDYAIEQLLRDE
ncbi:hypothetical protein GGU11DRAFT_750686 [Lentinula aff. detonsa]|nr:hypothetical protein GGU11DRAFT_750686 [Lentinula aff. detonsa]